MSPFLKKKKKRFSKLIAQVPGGAYFLKAFARDVWHLCDGSFLYIYIFGLQVQKQYFQWNSVQVKYDAFHMVMYELWMRRHLDC
jgi:hypothetical protein